MQNHDNNGQTDSGPEPFSEPETRAIRDSLKSFGANIFLSVHSGVLGMFTPHAYSLEDAEVNDDKMVDILDNLQNNHCPTCEVGSAGQAIGYLSPGSCIDYAYDELGVSQYPSNSVDQVLLRLRDLQRQRRPARRAQGVAAAAGQLPPGPVQRQAEEAAHPREAVAQLQRRVVLPPDRHQVGGLTVLAVGPTRRWRTRCASTTSTRRTKPTTTST